jgi:hypothetical protein
MKANTSVQNLNLGIIGNCAYSALVDERGSIVWCCLPRFDSDPVFNGLLDPSENGSLWAFELEDFARSEHQYEPNTAVLKTRLYDRQGQGIEITDFAPRFWSRGRTFRPLTHGAPRAGAGRDAAHAGGAAPALRLGPRASRASPAAAPTSATSARSRRCA